MVLFGDEEIGFDGARHCGDLHGGQVHQWVGESDFGAGRVWLMKSCVNPAALPLVQQLAPLGVAWPFSLSKLYNSTVHLKEGLAMDSIPYSEVRAHLAETLKQLEIRDQAIFISRRGEPAGVLMSVAQYQRLAGPVGKDFWSAVCAWRAENAYHLATADAQEDPFADLRDPTPTGGRDPVDFGAADGDADGHHRAR